MSYKCLENRRRLFVVSWCSQTAWIHFKFKYLRVEVHFLSNTIIIIFTENRRVWRIQIVEPENATRLNMNNKLFIQISVDDYYYLHF